MRTLHVAALEKFIPPFIELIRDEGIDHQFFFTYGDRGTFPYELNNDCKHVDNAKYKLISAFKRYIPLIIYMYRAEKIVLHGLFDKFLIIILFINPWLLSKCSWVIWGGDLYQENKKINIKDRIKEYFKTKVIKNINEIITYIDGDVKLARKKYGALGCYKQCIMYLSNVFYDENNAFFERKNDTINILLGNSADPSNNHIEALQLLDKYKDKNIKIYSPLSYGCQKHANFVSEFGAKKFGKKFEALTDYLTYDEYRSFLLSIDVAIFNHTRQQAMGNTINLIGLGKTVYLKRGTTQSQHFIEHGVKFNYVDEFKLDLLDKSARDENSLIIINNYSKIKLIEQLKLIL